jgi:hypothetical protein
MLIDWLFETVITYIYISTHKTHKLGGGGGVFKEQYAIVWVYIS